jgi:hypothetical protein
MPHVFVSYSRNNLDAITQLVGDLQSVGIDTWHDQTLTGGQRWWDNILANIRACDLFVFALSPESWDSEACRSELAYAMQLGKPIIPVVVSEGVNINLLPQPLNQIQVIDYRERDKKAAFALVRSINTALPTPPLPNPLPAPPHVPVSYLSTLKERIDSTGPLSAQDQKVLLSEIEEEFEEGRSPVEIRNLLLSLKRRNDLLAKVATKVNMLLNRLEDKSSVAPPLKEPQPKQCLRCHTRVEAGSKFCGSCGATLLEELIVPPPTERVHEVERSTSRRYLCAPGDTAGLITDVKGWLDAQEFDTQQMNTEGQSLLLQIKKRGGWRDFVGMATSLNIVFHPSGDTLTVEIGAGKWADKAAVGVVSMLILWPLAVTAGFGAWEQMKMPEKIFNYIGTRLVHK